VLINTQAHSRNCTPEEKADGNAQLMAITDDEARQQTIAARHAPLGLPKRATEEADNEILLYQEGYVLKHNNDLRTDLWTAHPAVRTVPGWCHR
jgi:hypothetical protein